MTTLNQVQLLEEKVESIVVKLQQLQAENDALRKQCAELTNALSSKSEQLSSYTSDQNEIEDGLKKALDRLNFIENSVLKASAVKTETTTIAPDGQVASSIQITPGVTPVTHSQLNQQTINNQEHVEAPVQTNISVQTSAPIQHSSPIVETNQVPPTTETFHTMNNVENTVEQAIEPEQDFQDSPIIDEPEIDIDDNDQDALGFDIF